jgi:inward rectifier potassium channel
MSKSRSTVSSRVARADGKGYVTRLGIRPSPLRDLYHFLLTVSWPALLGMIALLYLSVNAVFAMLYMAGGDSIVNARPGSFSDAFFFSVQTMATIGYGVYSPKTTWAHSLVTLEALSGALFVALSTGLMFAKFARPTSRVLFSEIAVITPRDGVPALMFRLANVRSNQIVEATAKVAVLKTELTKEGETLRRLHDLALLRDSTPSLTLTWTVVHPIVPGSPLHGMTPADAEREKIQVLVSISGIDDALSAMVHARKVYFWNDLVWGARFVDILDRLRDGEDVVDYTRFHETTPTPLPVAAPATPAAG